MRALKLQAWLFAELALAGVVSFGLWLGFEYCGMAPAAAGWISGVVCGVAVCGALMDANDRDR